MITKKNSRSFFKNLLTGSAVLLATTAISVDAVVSESATQSVSPLALSNNEPISDRIIVKYKNTSSMGLMSTMSTNSMQSMSRVAGAELRYLRRMAAANSHVFKLRRKAASRAALEKMVNRLNADPNVEFAHIDRLMKPMFTPNDSRYNEQWHYFESTGGLNLPTAWDTTTGEGVVVAVLDTGYRPHADLDGNLLPGYDMINDPEVGQDGDGRDSNAIDPGDWAPAGACGPGEPESTSSWHGTHVAGTIAAETNNGIGVAGVAFGAKIVPVRVLGRCGGYTSDIADGMIWAAGGSVSGVPTNPNPAQVLNLSLGGGGACDQATQNAINTARSLGATVVVAAGNSNTNASNATPANCSGVVTVASTGRDGSRAYYSNFGNVVDVAAPGGAMSFAGDSNGVLSTLNSGSQGPVSDNYEFSQGTSMAAPHVAGAAALLYAVDPFITPDEVENVLKSTARAFPATCSQCGTGIVDAAAAVAAVSGGPTPTPTPGGSELENGVAKTGLSGSQGSEQVFTLTVPAGATDLSFQTSGGSGDVDMYVKFGSAPTTGDYDCRPYRNGNNESCPFTTAQAGTYYVMLRGYSAYSGVSLVGSYVASAPPTPTPTPTPSAGISESNLSGSSRTWRHFSMEVPAGASSLSAVISGGSGDADLYVRFGSQPTSRNYNCRPYQNGNNESCNISNPSAGTWFVSIRAYSAYSGVDLEASAN